MGKIYLVGPSGVGKSHILNQLNRETDIPCHYDPIMENDIHGKIQNPAIKQHLIYTHFFNRHMMNRDGVFDTSLVQACVYRMVAAGMGIINEVDNQILFSLESLYMAMGAMNKDIFILLTADEETLVSNRTKRDRDYEKGNEFLDKVDEVLVDELRQALDRMGVLYWEHNIEDGNVQPVIDKIKEMYVGGNSNEIH